MPRGRGVRCAGFTLDTVAYCTREELAGRLELELTTSPPAFKHLLRGGCRCGQEHGAGPLAPLSPPAGGNAAFDGMAIETRDAIYSRALELLTLRPEGLADLMRRGLSKEAIEAGRFRSIPKKGSELAQFRDRLVAEFGEATLRRCPGFTDKNGRLTFWAAVGKRDGYVVPYLDEQGRITGLQARFLDGKYLTARGASLDSVYHVSGDGQAGADLYLTEGGLKATVAASLGGIGCFGLAGQSLQEGHVQALRRLKPGRVVVALDQEENAGTNRARERIERSLWEAGLTVARAVWEGEDVGGAKGLDDLFQTGGRPRLRPVHLGPKGLNHRRLPYAVSEPGEVDSGVALGIVREETQKAIKDFCKPGTNAGRALLVRTPPGAGKTTAVGEAVRTRGVQARVLAGTKKLAQELADKHNYVLIEGRNPSNCRRHDVVKALGDNGHDVERLACGKSDEPRCEYRGSCGYWEQFHAVGPRVASAEQLYNLHYLQGGNLLVLDDADLVRSVLTRFQVSTEAIASAVAQLRGKRRARGTALLKLLQHALVDAPDRPLMGAAVWDHLARTATRYHLDLSALIEDLPAHGTLPEPAEDASGYLSVATVEAVPPASILRILDALREELPHFQQGGDFNCRLRLTVRGIEVRELREHIAGRDGPPVAAMAMLILDATPVDPLVDHVAKLHHRLPDLAGDVPLPGNVRVVQYATGMNGHSSLRSEEVLGALLAEVQRERLRHPVSSPDREAAVVFKSHRPRLLGVGFDSSRVLTYGGLRGTNALVGVERLQVIGRPMPPGDELVYLAQVIHHDDRVVSPEMVLRTQPFGGQRAAVDVVDFCDERASTLLRAGRDDELTQVIHRARLLALDPQAAFDGSEERRRVRLVLHTSHPIPGLRVDELVLPKGLDLVLGKENELPIDGAPLGNISEAPIGERIGRGAGTPRSQTQGEGLGKEIVVPSSRSKKGENCPQAKAVTPLFPSEDPLDEPGKSAINGRAGRGLCRGGCGLSVPGGGKCADCATAAVREWRTHRSRGRRRARGVPGT